MLISKYFLNVSASDACVLLSNPLADSGLTVCLCRLATRSRNTWAPWWCAWASWSC
jgi:hypothetical protein